MCFNPVLNSNYKLWIAGKVAKWEHVNNSLKLTYIQQGLQGQLNILLVENYDLKTMLQIWCSL